MKVNEKQMKKITESSNLIALDIAEKLVSRWRPFQDNSSHCWYLGSVGHLNQKNQFQN